MKFAGRSQLPPDPHGRQVEAGNPRAGVVDDGNVAWPERVEQARRRWPQGRVEDFAKIGRRRYLDKGSGLELVAVRGCPLLGSQEEGRGISVFVIEQGRIVCLRREDHEQPLYGAAGYVHSQQVVAGNGPEGPRIV